MKLRRTQFYLALAFAAFAYCCLVHHTLSNMKNQGGRSTVETRIRPLGGAELVTIRITWEK